MHWHFTVKKNNIRKHMPITSKHLISSIIAKIISKICLILILKIELIDTESITMHKSCAVKDKDIYSMVS